MANVNTAQNQQLRFADNPTGLRIRLLGPMTVTNDGRPVPIAAKKARALLGYLALREGTEVARSIMTGLLWSERSESQARASLTAYFTMKNQRDHSFIQMNSSPLLRAPLGLRKMTAHSMILVHQMQIP